MAAPGPATFPRRTGLAPSHAFSSVLSLVSSAVSFYSHLLFSYFPFSCFYRFLCHLRRSTLLCIYLSSYNHHYSYFSPFFPPFPLFLYLPLSLPLHSPSLSPFLSLSFSSVYVSEMGGRAGARGGGVTWLSFIHSRFFLTFLSCCSFLYVFPPFPLSPLLCRLTVIRLHCLTLSLLLHSCSFTSFSSAILPLSRSLYNFFRFLSFFGIVLRLSISQTCKSEMGKLEDKRRREGRGRAREGGGT